MADSTTDQFDVAIVGAGVSGLYCAWRLANDPGTRNLRIVVFECSGRIGGRLWSYGLEDEATIPTELGGMYFSDTQPLVYDLCTKKLGLTTQTVTPKPDFAYLRSNRFRISDFEKPDVIPYRLAEDETGKPYHALIHLALSRIVPDVDQYWPLDASGEVSDLLHYLRNVTFEDRRLYQWGFWNLLAKVVSNEAYFCLRDLVSSFSFFSNWNAYDATLSLLQELSGNWYKLPRGYQTLPETLRANAESAGVEVFTEHRVVEITTDGDSGSIRLGVVHRDNRLSFSVDHVVCALPKQAIGSLGVNGLAQEDEDFLNLLTAVDAVPACKIFLTFAEPWWRRVPDGPGIINEGTFAASHTDLPLRQCYYLGMDPGSGEGLLLASYSDAQSVPFWTTLMTESGRPDGLVCELPVAARTEICRQLSEMHGVDVPRPDDGIFVNWSAEPYGGGWHAWLPGWESWKVMSALRRPFPQRNIYYCGEAFCAHQGWVEGALTSAEMLLQQQFHLGCPDWLSSTVTLAPYQ